MPLFYGMVLFESNVYCKHATIIKTENQNNTYSKSVFNSIQKFIVKMKAVKKVLNNDL